jgi:hypothetical protein
MTYVLQFILLLKSYYVPIYILLLIFKKRFVIRFLYFTFRILMFNLLRFILHTNIVIHW